MNNGIIPSSKDVISEDFLPEYEKGMDFLFSELVHLNKIIFILEKIIAFPFDLFVENDKHIFFSMVVRNFLENAVLIITKLVTDQGSSFFTIKKFKNKVYKAIKREYKETFKKLIDQSKFDKQTEELFSKTRTIRNYRIGHTREEVVMGTSDEVILFFSQIKDMYSKLEDLFKVLSFDVFHVMLPIPYKNSLQYPNQSKYKSDIEELLDLLVKNSVLFNLPESNPKEWESWKTEYSNEQIEEINIYRKKFGLPVLSI